MIGLTEIQVLVLKLILQRMRDWGMPPTHREMAAHFNWRSNAAAKCHVLALEKKGFIHVIPDISRGIFLMPAGVRFRDENTIETLGPSPIAPDFNFWYRNLMGKPYTPPVMPHLKKELDTTPAAADIEPAAWMARIRERRG